MIEHNKTDQRPSQAGYEMRPDAKDNPCAFMKLPVCMRQDQAKRLDLTICNVCITGRMEGHLFAIREKLVGKEQRRTNYNG